MMAYYLVKRDLWAVRRGTVERFMDHKAAQLVREGAIEPYDEKRHGERPGAPARKAQPKVEK